MPRSVLLFVVPDVVLIVPAPAQVADSFVGRYFRLEGSGHPKEREGSRFLVRPLLFPTFAAILTTTTTMPDRDPRWPYNMGEYRPTPPHHTSTYPRCAQAAMAYIVRTLSPDPHVCASSSKRFHVS